MHILAAPGDDNVVRAVDRRQRHRLRIGGDGSRHAALFGKDCRHGPACGQRTHQPPTRGHQFQAVFQAEHPRYCGRHQFADAVAHDKVGRHTPRLPHLRQGIFDGKERGLRIGRVVEAIGSAGKALNYVKQRLGQIGAQDGGAAVHCRAEDRLRSIEPAPHSSILSALPCEQERDLGPGSLGQPVQNPCRLLARNKGRQLLRHLRGRCPYDSQAERQVCTTAVGRITHVLQVRPGISPRSQGLCITPGQLRQRRRLLGGQCQQVQRTPLRVRRKRRGVRRTFPSFHHHMHVGAAEAKGADTANLPARNGGPCRRLGRHHKRQLCPRNKRAGCVKVDLRWDFSMLKRQHEFDQPRYAGCRFGVAETGLDRTQQQRLLRAVAGTEDRPQRLHLDGVAQRGAGSVRLNIAHQHRVDARLSQRRTHDNFLRRAVGCGEAAGCAVLVHGAAADHG